MIGRTALLLVTTALALIVAGGVALAATFTCTINPCVGTTEDDVITGTVGAETINGRAGNDQISARDANDTINGEESNDTMHGELGDDSLNGGDGSDQLFGEDGRDALNGGAGDDTLDGGQGPDIYSLTSNWGSDTVVDPNTIPPNTVPSSTAGLAEFSGRGSNNSLTINLESGSGPEVTDGNGNTMNWEGNAVWLANGGPADDTFIQNSFINWMSGGEGADTYTGYGPGGPATKSDYISAADTTTASDKLDLTNFNLADISKWEVAQVFVDGNDKSLRITFADGSKISIYRYFDPNGSTDICASKKGSGYLERIVFNDDDIVDFAQVRSLLGCPPQETTPPMVNNTIPVNNATAIAPAANVNATFSEAMAAPTINGSTFMLQQGNNPALTDPKVPASVSYNSGSQTATLDPTAYLEYSKTYTATVTTGAEDLVGNQLDQDPITSGNQPKTWSFKTAAGVSNVTPSEQARNVPLDTPVTAKFSEDVTGVTVDTFMLGKGVLDSSQLPGATSIGSGTTVSYQPSTMTATLDPYGSKKTTLERCQWYTAKVTSSVKDKAGNPVVEKLWYFQTAGNKTCS
jgi:hypothetical protein